MNRKFFTVDDRFSIKGRGTVVTGELETNALPCKLGNVIVLLRPDGNEMTTESGGIDMIKTVSGKEKIAVLIKNIKKEEVPVGTLVFLQT